MLYVRITFHVHQIVDFDRSIIGDSTEIVATEIDQHHVFGDLFFIRLQIFAQHPVFGFRSAALSGARDRAIVESLSMTTHQHLG